MSVTTVRTAICKACRTLEERDLVSVASGNVSVRLPDGHIAVTPSQVPYATLAPEQIVVVSRDGYTIEGEAPSSELPSHLAIHRARLDAGAVVHSHSTYATALAVAGRDLPVVLDEQVMMLGGPVRVAEFAPSSSQELAENVVAALGEGRAALLSNHGAISVGRDLDEAVAVATFLERVAKIYAIANAIGTPRDLPDEALRAQIEAFRKRRDG